MHFVSHSCVILIIFDDCQNVFHSKRFLFISFHFYLARGAQFKSSGLNSSCEPPMADFFWKLRICSSTIFGEVEMMC